MIPSNTERVLSGSIIPNFAAYPVLNMLLTTYMAGLHPRSLYSSLVDELGCYALSSRAWKSITGAADLLLVHIVVLHMSVEGVQWWASYILLSKEILLGPPW